MRRSSCKSKVCSRTHTAGGAAEHEAGVHHAGQRRHQKLAATKCGFRQLTVDGEYGVALLRGQRVVVHEDAAVRPPREHSLLKVDLPVRPQAEHIARLRAEQLRQAARPAGIPLLSVGVGSDVRSWSQLLLTWSGRIDCLQKTGMSPSATRFEGHSSDRRCARWLSQELASHAMDCSGLYKACRGQSTQHPPTVMLF